MSGEARNPGPSYVVDPAGHRHRVVKSGDVRGDSVLDLIATYVSRFVGSMWTFVGVTTFIVVWLFAGNIVGFDRTPWPLLLTIINLPQLSIMISLQVSANLAQKTSDARADADHETLVALHTMARQQLEILEGQNRILDVLKQRAEPPAS
jgi:low affinity Fe/Cu permease